MKFFGLTITFNGYDIWHKGNMGSGSTLDADKLDGQEGLYYSNYNNLSNKPTIPSATSQLTNDSGYTQIIISSTQPSGHVVGRVWIQTL